MKKSLIIIPTYNEAQNCELLHKKIRENNKEIDILFIDDNSPDKTYTVVEKIIEKDPKTILKRRNSKQGIGSAHKFGFRWAFENKYNIVLTIDADLSHDPGLINDMIKLSAEYDIIITGRFLNKDSLEEWSIYRKFITHSRHLVVKFLFKIPYDTSGAFRCYDFSKIKLDDLFIAKDNGYSFFWESLITLYYKNYTICELPMKQPSRKKGSSKISFKDIFKAIYYLIFFYLKFRKKIKN